MSVNDDSLQAGSDSFWEVGKYMRTVKRIDNGHHLCGQLRKLIEERNEIEKRYAGMLQEWSKKWGSFLDKDIEYGTTEGAWRSLLTEAEEVANLHIRMADKLMSDVFTSIKAWQKENYHKSMMHFKETKELEENFRKAQKPWAKRLTKMLAAKKEYHTACRAEKTAAHQENNAKLDSSLSPEQTKKLQDKLRKCQQEVESTKEKYKAALNDINSYNAKYVEDMTEVYKKCQEFEQKRIEFFKKIFFQIHSCLDLSSDNKFSQIYTSLNSTINNVDHSKDLKWWSSSHGVDMAMNWPEFEEYSPELQAISKKSKTNLNVDSGVVMTGIKHSREDSYGQYTNEAGPTQTRPSQLSNMQASTISQGGASNAALNTATGYDESLNPFDDEEEIEDGEEQCDDVADKEENDSNEKQDIPKSAVIPETPSANIVNENKSAPDSPVQPGDNPFGDHDDEEEDSKGVITPAQGWAVRAIYDYVRAEEDELEFKAGDIFVQLTDEDDMGWCQGKKDGKIGFYPRQYVERI